MPRFSDRVLIQLTHYGVEVLQEYNRKNPDDMIVYDVCEDGRVWMRLCDAMCVFGTYMCGYIPVVDEDFLCE